MPLTLPQLLDSVASYSKRYRRTDIANLEISDIYCLFPSDSSIFGWPQVYPNADRAGVYAILSQQQKVLYIGKASFKNSLSARLGKYFGYGLDRKSSCVFNLESWSEPPFWVVTIAVPVGMEFEAPALEEFLITAHREDLPDNTIGTWH